MPLFSRRLGAWVDPADVFVTLYSSDATAFWLDRANHPTKRFSIMGHAHGGVVLSTGEMFEAFENQERRPDGEKLPFDWRPGYVGWFEYQQNPLATDAPTGSWLDVREALVFDHDGRAMWAIGNFRDQAHFDDWLKAGFIRLGLSGGRRIGYLRNHRIQRASEITSLAHSPAEYAQLVDQARQHIASGDIYQICLTNRLEARHGADPLEVFLRLRESNPAPYACYIRNGEVALVSVSPEQFLTVSSEGIATTRPIKGTRPRSSDANVDLELAEELASNQKELAENLMIVDLMRNDLTRVSDPASVEVVDLFAVEAHPSVHQLVSTVSSRLLQNISLRDLIAAIFPGGSMTGAPKIRAMQLINELERKPRGVYSGAAGFIGADGALDLGMVIRSLVFEGERVSIGVGGGITIDSQPLAEVAETELKAKALLSAIGLESPWQ